MIARWISAVRRVVAVIRNMRNYPGLFAWINRNYNQLPGSARGELAAIVQRPMENADVDSAFALIVNYTWSDGDVA